MLISVIMGIYNMKNVTFAKKALDSIFNQSFENFELIICNDGSTNVEYTEIIEYALLDSRVKVISNEKNMGLAYSLNECLKIAKGEYVARMDIDDEISLERFRTQVNFAKNNPQYDIIGTNATLMDEYEVWGSLVMPLIPNEKDFLRNSPFIHASTLIRKEKLVEVGGYRIAKETRRAEDFDLWMRMYAVGCVGYNIQELLYFIREDKNAYSRRKYIYRIDEAKVRYKGYKKLGILKLTTIKYVMRPLIVGLIPNFIMKKIRKNRKGK